MQKNRQIGKGGHYLWLTLYLLKAKIYIYLSKNTKGNVVQSRYINILQNTSNFHVTVTNQES